MNTTPFYLNNFCSKVFNFLADKCEQEDNQYFILNNNDAFMPLSVELLFENEFFKMFSFAHYYKQNGDLIPDPDMCFLKFKSDNLIIPYSIQNFYSYSEVISVKDNKFFVTNHKGLYDLNQFVKIWFKNIVYQQNLSIK